LTQWLDARSSDIDASAVVVHHDHYSANPYDECPLTEMQAGIFFFVVFVADFQQLFNTTFFLEMTAITP
jgi:hypothetical protein